MLEHLGTIHGGCVVVEVVVLVEEASEDLEEVVQVVVEVAEAGNINICIQKFHTKN
jgi:hypothetical protein